MARNLSKAEKHKLLDLIKQGLKVRELQAAMNVSTATISRLKRSVGIGMGTQNKEPLSSVYIFSHDRPRDNFGEAF